MTRHDLVGKVTHWEFCKIYKFDYMNKWYMQNPKSASENETKFSGIDKYRPESEKSDKCLDFAKELKKLWK